LSIDDGFARLDPARTDDARERRAHHGVVGLLASLRELRAPFAGIVSARRVEPGETIVNGQSLMSLYAPGALRIQVQVPQSDADAIRAVHRAHVGLADGRGVDASEVTVFPSADPTTHSVTVRVVLPAMKEPLQPGVTAKVGFAIPGDVRELRIPRTALVQRGEVSGVYVRDGNQLALRQLRLGQSVGDQVEVLSGLTSGETIATDPVAALQALIAQRKAAGNAGE
jgi:RND family efflux transporter MFP subunit